MVRDLFVIESATFWKEGPDNPDPAKIDTEVFFLPAAAGAEKAGTLTNTQRLLQWHDKAVDPPGDCRSDLWFVWNLGNRLKQLYAGSIQRARPGPAQPDLGLRPRRPRILPDGSASRIDGRAGAPRRC